VEVEMRRRIDAIRAAAEIGAVEIKLQDFVLGQACLEPQRQERLAHLSLERAFAAEKQVFGELLGDRRAALYHAARARIGKQRAEGAGNVDAEVVVETPLFGGERRLDQVVGKIFDLERIVMFDAAAADRVAVTIKKGDRELGLFQPVCV